MKHLMTLMALVVAVTAGAQGTTIHEYPWNPDWNNDNYIGSQDLTGFLSAFGSEFGNPPEPCDYDGSTFENWASNWLNGDIVLDSCFIEYELEDAVTFYIPGCPEPITDTVIHANSFMLRHPYSTADAVSIRNAGHWRSFGLSYDAQNGTYAWTIDSHYYEMQEFSADGFFGSNLISNTLSTNLPFPIEWIFDSNGIELIWDSGWATYANYLHILPYWHYAE